MALTRKIRFAPDPGDFALIDVDFQREDFEPQIIGLILNESSQGCALVLKTDETLKQGNRCRIKVGRNAPLLAEIRWLKQLDQEVIKAGFHLLE